MRHIRRILAILLIILLVLALLPFAIPIQEGGTPPAQLVTDSDGGFLSLQGVNVYYEDKGEPDAPTVLLVHGLFGSTETWRYNIDAMVSAGYRVLAYDRPGFGLSDKPESFDYSVSNQVELMAAFLDALSLERAVIAGHSAGANIAAHFAERYPQRVEKLVLANAAVLAGGPPPFVGALVSFPPVWRWGRIGLQAYFTRGNLENSLASFYVNPSFLTEADYDVYWRAFQTAGWDIGLLGLTRDSSGGRLSEDAIRGIEAETLLIWGDQDTVTPLDQGQTLDQWITQSTLVIIPDSGHQPFEETADAFNEFLIEFIRDRRP